MGWLNNEFMKTIARFSLLEQAQMAKAQLGSAGIEAFIPDEMSAGTIPYLFTTKAGIRLQVSEQDENEALQILEIEQDGE